jgi:UDP-2-acetamido-2,6-beta-L-arabino-hexul-4-ose reductase
MRVLVTGAAGFLGKNLVFALGREPEFEVIPFDLNSKPGALDVGLDTADALVHLAGVNRPKDEAEYEAGNAGFTEELIQGLLRRGGKIPVLLASSTQAALDNAYGKSKQRAEAALGRYAEQAGAPVYLFRFPNIFGKWCRPNYNSAVATFCHNIARDLPITISDPAHELELVYVDDAVALLKDAIRAQDFTPGARQVAIHPTYRATLGDLAARITSFRGSRKDLMVADMSDGLTKRLYATYASCLEGADLGYALEVRSDARGSLAELLKSPSFGQLFVSRTKPGITRGNHYHDTKAEKFVVLDGSAVIRFRHMVTGEQREYAVSGTDFQVVDIPPGWTHSIQNVGDSEMVVLFWANELLDPKVPDTYHAEVLND